MTHSPTPWLTPHEIADLCHPLKQRAAQRTFLERLGLVVNAKPNGDPLVLRSNAESVLGAGSAGKNAGQPKTAPNRDALILAFTKKQG